jgi:hypothetical protein
MEELLGEATRGFSPTNIVRLKEVWEKEYRTCKERDLTGSDYVYVWADGANFSIRLEEDRLTCLVLIEVRQDGEKELIALEDGHRESKEAWLSVLRDLKRKGCPLPRWRWATALWASGRRWARSIPRRPSNAAGHPLGAIGCATCSTSCPTASRSAPGNCCAR